MAELERKEVRISKQFDLDIISVYTFGEQVFGAIAAKSFVADIYSPEALGMEFRQHVPPSFGMQAFTNHRQALPQHYSWFLPDYLQNQSPAHYLMLKEIRNKRPVRPIVLLWVPSNRDRFTYRRSPDFYRDQFPLSTHPRKDQQRQTGKAS